MTDGINTIFVYCDEVEHSIVRNTHSKLLAIVPIQVEGQGSAALCAYTYKSTIYSIHYTYKST